VTELDELFARLARSRFRSSKKLGAKDAQYLRDKGLKAVMDHARGFIAQRLAPAHPPNDGKQTPWRGHPVFVAQHATACCCRGCLAKWHAIGKGHELTEEEQRHVLAALERWLREQSTEDGLVR
jgi:predicted Fe-S protein YdhL (DUF1289 family)